MTRLAALGTEGALEISTAKVGCHPRQHYSSEVPLCGVCGVRGAGVIIDISLFALARGE